MVNYYLVPKSKEFFQQKKKKRSFPRRKLSPRKINIFTITASFLTSGGTHVDKLFHFFHPIGTPITRVIKTNRDQLISIL